MAHNELSLSGWAASPKRVAGIAIQIGDRQWNASYGLDTPELENRLRGFPDATRAGYRLDIDTSDWTAGPHHVTVAAFDLEGGRSAIEGQVEVRPFDTSATASPSAPVTRDGVTLSVDNPVVADGACEIEGPLEISGWAHADEGIEAVVVTLDGGALQYEALRPVVRPDLLEELGRETAANAGFALLIDPADCPPGRHRLSIAALSQDGRSSGVECDLVCRPTDVTSVPTDVEWTSDRVTPTIRDDETELSDSAMWKSRALLAESDAALCRAEANLARTAQEAALRSLRDIEARTGLAGRPPRA